MHDIYEVINATDAAFQAGRLRGRMEVLEKLAEGLKIIPPEDLYEALRCWVANPHEEE